MPATATGRGAQVIIDPGSDTGRAIRGAYAATLEGNAAKVATDVLLGTLASGEGADGIPVPGVRATDYVTAPSAAAGVHRLLYVNGTSVGNGADLTVDVLMSFDIPANTFRNFGDAVRIFAGGTMIGSTDQRNARLTFGGTNIATPGTTGASITGWAIEAMVIWRSGNQFSLASHNSLANSNVNGLIAQTSNKPVTAPITVTITGQNATNSVAGSVTCQLLVVEFIPGPAGP